MALPTRELRLVAAELRKLEAQATLRDLTVATFVHWSGPQQDARAAAREGQRKRRRYLQEVQRAALGLGKHDPAPGVAVLRSGAEVRAFLGAHGINAS